MQGNSFLDRRFNKTLAAFLFFVCLTRLAHSQTGANGSKSVDLNPPEATTKKDGNGNSSKSTAEIGLPPASSRWVPNKYGIPVEIPNGPTYDAFEKFLELYLENRARPKEPAAATVTAVKIMGTADDDRANLKAAITIRVQPEDQFVSIPLYFNEASLRQESYIGDGECAFHEKDSEKGFTWWFRGRGQHRLELTFSVPLKKQLPSRSLSLTLPMSPVSGAQITLPYPKVIARVLPEQSVIDVRPAGAETTVEVIGLGSKLNLTWQPNVDVRPHEVSLEAQTTIRAQIEPDHVLIRADQQIKALQGLFDQVVVTLPTGAELIRLDDPEKLSYKNDPKNPEKVIVSLKEKATFAQLNWTLRFPGKTKTLTIDGFSVEGARKHAGKIGLAHAVGLRISEPRDSSMSSVSVGEFPSAMGPVVRAYQFFNQPFKLTTNIDDVKPYFQVRPQMQLIASAQQLILDGEFEFHVDRDSLNEVFLIWPSYKSEGWTIDTVDEPGVVESYSTDDKGQITVRLVKRLSGKFSIHIRASRPINVADESVFSLPRPKSASRLTPATLIVINAENVKTELMPRGETIFHLLPASSLELLTLAANLRALKTTVYRVETNEQSFGLRVSPQKQQIHTESSTEANWQDNQFQIVQRLIYDVSYERISQIRITVPSTIQMDRIQFLTSQNIELRPELSPSSSEAPRQIQLKLPESQLGHFEIHAKFAVPCAKENAIETDAFVTLPILGSSDDPFSQTRFAISQSDWFDAELNATDLWHPQLNTKKAWEWKAEGMQLTLPLKLVRSTHANEKGTVSAAVVKVTLDGTGDGVVRSQFRLSTRATTLPVNLPATAKTKPDFYWDQNLLTDRDCVEWPVGSRRYSIQLPDQVEGTAPVEHLLTIDYGDDFGSTMGWSDRLKLRAPQIPNCSWSQVVWQTDLPAGQHMLTYPESANPMFHWQRTGFVWSRVSEPDSTRLQQWVTAEVKGLPPASKILLNETQGNLYAFSQFDAPKPLEFQTLSSPMVFLFGAGFSLAAGFLMLRIAVLRHVLTLLVMGLVVAIVGLWYAAPLELLLQPMIAGLIFPALAVFLEGWIRRRNNDAIPAFEGPDDFPPLHTFGSHYVVRQSDPNEATQHRQVTRDSAPILPIETGSGVS